MLQLLRGFFKKLADMGLCALDGKDLVKEKEIGNTVNILKVYAYVTGL